MFKKILLKFKPKYVVELENKLQVLEQENRELKDRLEISGENILDSFKWEALHPKQIEILSRLGSPEVQEVLIYVLKQKRNSYAVSLVENAFTNSANDKNFNERQSILINGIHLGYNDVLLLGKEAFNKLKIPKS